MFSKMMGTIIPSIASSQQQRKAALPVVVVSSIWLMVWGWSTFVVQPRTIVTYQEKARQSLLDARIINADGKTLDVTNWLENEDSEMLLARRRSLNESSLFLRRLIDVVPETSRLRLQLAATAEASTQLYTKLAYQAMSHGDAVQAESFRRKAISESIVAEDTMERLAKEDNEEAVVAKAWQLARSLRAPIRDGQLIEKRLTSALDILEKDPVNRIGRVRLGQLKIYQAYSIERQVPLEERRSAIQEAVDLLSEIDSPSMIEKSFLAEAQDALSPEQALQTSVEASQGFWSDMTGEKQSPEGLAALFGCLMRLGSLQEAQNLLATKLASISPGDQLLLRGLCSDYCVRRIVCQNNFPSPLRQISSIDALQLATRIDAQSPNLLGLLERLVFNIAEDTLSHQLGDELIDEKNRSLYHLILSVRAAHDDEWTVSREEIRLAIESDVGLSSVAVPIMGHLVANHSFSLESAVQFLDHALEVSSEATSLFFASAVFYEKHDRLEKAAECLEKILEQTNYDSQVLSFLATIYARLDRTDDLKRIQLELQKSRKQPS